MFTPFGLDVTAQARIAPAAVKIRPTPNYIEPHLLYQTLAYSTPAGRKAVKVRERARRVSLGADRGAEHGVELLEPGLARAVHGHRARLASGRDRDEARRDVRVHARALDDCRHGEEALGGGQLAQAVAERN